MDAAAVDVDWVTEGARAKENAMMEIAKFDPESDPHQYRHDLELEKLREIPSRVFDLQHLTRVFLLGDMSEGSPLRLTVIPSEIGQLTNLEQLIISNNSLTTLPESFSQLTRMQHLELQANGLIQLPAGIGNLQQLRVRCVTTLID